MSATATAPRITLNIRRFRIKDHIQSGRERPFNALVVGPSDSRKNACIQRLIDIAHPRNGRLVVVTDHPDFYHESVYNAQAELPFAELEDADCRVLEGIPSLTADHFRFFETEPPCTTIIASPDYPRQLPRNSWAALDYVFVFGGLKQLRRAWEDLSALIPKFRDFRQIYLACTNEGDRYSDDFMVVRNDSRTTDPNDVIFWGSLTRKDVEEISVETSLVLNKVQTALHVRLPKPKSHTAVEAHAMVPEEDDNDEEASGDEREERADCCVM